MEKKKKKPKKKKKKKKKKKTSVLRLDNYKIASTFVCPSNSGFGTLTETTHVNPSLTCSPPKVISLSWKKTEDASQY
jgi:hypothetical protein